VRTDRMSVYGHHRPTTPFVDSWAEEARVFDRCTSTGSSTVPAHGAMFTGLFPSEHGANSRHRHLDARHETLAEILQGNGYDTFLFSANPHISAEENFAQGFMTAQHPWDERNAARAVRMIRGKVDPRDRSNELVHGIRKGRINKLFTKDGGVLARENLIEWLGQRDGKRPYFAFLNYMEAHQPYIPRLEYRRRFMTPEQINRSFRTDYSWLTIWKYTFGFHEYSDAALEDLGGLYDACLAELDDLFKDLLESLDEAGYLENTIVVLTSDHGEHLGEHGMLDHQFSLYEELLRVPLLISWPGTIDPGREETPVVNFDLFPTLLELAGLETPRGLPGHAVNLASPSRNRLRMAEYPSEFEYAITRVKKHHADWDPSPYQRQLTAYYHEDKKLIWASDGRHELYDLADDPLEGNNLVGVDGAGFERMKNGLKKAMQGIRHFDYNAAEKPELSREQLQRLEALGYADGGQ
jgi:arylsulfatase A-like enzyme